jgi:hypothetical protein
VKSECENGLIHCDAQQLIVYPPGTEVTTEGYENRRLKEPIECSNIQGVSYETPFIVVAPAAHQEGKSRFVPYSCVVDVACFVLFSGNTHAPFIRPKL